MPPDISPGASVKSGGFMSFLVYISPLLLGVLGNVLYNVVGKSTPKKINPFFSLAATYCVALVVCVILFFVTSRGGSIIAAASEANWTSYCLGVCIVFTDLSLILLFRAGWDISIGSLIANIACSVIVVIIGVLVLCNKLARQACGGRRQRDGSAPLTYQIQTKTI